MSEGVQIYRCDNAAICKEDFFNMTKLNFEYDRRRLFTRKKNKWEYNNYFPFDLVNERLGFYGLYLSCYTDLDFASLDFDFDIGLNNLEYNFEEKLISCLKNEYSRIVIEILNSQANKSIIEKIESEYNILFSSVGIYNIYVISFSNIEEISFIQKYILCILLDEDKVQMSFEQYSFNPVDLKCIMGLIGQVRLLIFRVPLYANYNIMIYSKDEQLINMVNTKILELKNDDFDIQNIREFRDEKNFLVTLH